MDFAVDRGYTAGLLRNVTDVHLHEWSLVLLDEIAMHFPYHLAQKNMQNEFCIPQVFPATMHAHISKIWWTFAFADKMTGSFFVDGFLHWPINFSAPPFITYLIGLHNLAAASAKLAVLHVI